MVMTELTGERTKVVKWIQGDNFVVRVMVDAIIPDFDPSESCLEPRTVRFLDEVQEKANRRLFAELEKVGEIYVKQPA